MRDFSKSELQAICLAIREMINNGSDRCVTITHSRVHPSVEFIAWDILLDRVISMILECEREEEFYEI